MNINDEEVMVIEEPQKANAENASSHELSFIVKR